MAQHLAVGTAEDPNSGPQPSVAAVTMSGVPSPSTSAAATWIPPRKVGSNAKNPSSPAGQWVAGFAVEDANQRRSANTGRNNDVGEPVLVEVSGRHANPAGEAATVDGGFEAEVAGLGLATAARTGAIPTPAPAKITGIGRGRPSRTIRSSNGISWRVNSVEPGGVVTWIHG